MAETITPQAIVDQMPEYFLPEKAGNTNAGIQFDLSGDQGGKYWVKIADGAATSGQGDVENPNLTLLADSADFVKIFADRYKTGSPYGHVDAIEIWNEPNLRSEWGATISQQTAAEYVQMLSLSYAAVKSVDPNIMVVTAGLSPTGDYDGSAAPDDQFLQWMYNDGLSGHYDILGLNANAQVADPTAVPGSVPGFADGSFYFRRVEQMRAIEEGNGDVNPVWLVEYGWTSDAVHADRSWYAVSEDQKGANILSAMRYARANWPWLGVMTLWGMPDPNWTPDREEYWWMVSNPNGTDRPALDALINAAQTNTLP